MLSRRNPIPQADISSPNEEVEPTPEAQTSSLHKSPQLLPGVWSATPTVFGCIDAVESRGSNKEYKEGKESEALVNSTGEA